MSYEGKEYIVKKIRMVIVTVLMLLLVLACWKMNKGNAVKIKLGDVDEGPRIIVGTLGMGEPYSAITDDGIWQGFEADVWSEVEKRSGMAVELKQIESSEKIFEQLKNEEIDVAANCFSITQSRLEEYIASGPLYADVCVVTVGEESKYQALQDLRKCTVGVTGGQIPDKVLEVLTEEFEWNLKTYEEEEAGLQDYKDGKIDAFAGRLIQINKLEKMLNIDLRVLEHPLYGSHVGWLFNDTESGAKLRDEFNIYIADMQKDGTLSKISEKWFGTDMTKFISEQWFVKTR